MCKIQKKKKKERIMALILNLVRKANVTQRRI